MLAYFQGLQKRVMSEIRRRQVGKSAEVKFDPAQPRDEEGKWTTTGAGYGRGQVPDKAGELNAKKVDKMLSGELEKGWCGVGEKERQDAKNEICQSLLEEMGISSPDLALDAEQAWAMGDKYNETYDQVNDVMGQWAESSNDFDARSLAMQQDAALEFGVEESAFTLERVNRVRGQADTVATADQLDFAELVTSYGKNSFSPLMPSEQQRAALRAMYNHTQAQLRAAGLKPGDTVRLYRGVKIDRRTSGAWETSDIVSLTGNALESWSLGRRVAMQFAHGTFDAMNMRGVVFEMDVPVEAIFSTARTGLGCLAEGELVILGIPGEARVDWLR